MKTLTNAQLKTEVNLCRAAGIFLSPSWLESTADIGAYMKLDRTGAPFTLNRMERTKYAPIIHSMMHNAPKPPVITPNLERAENMALSLHDDWD